MVQQQQHVIECRSEYDPASRRDVWTGTLSCGCRFLKPKTKAAAPLRLKCEKHLERVAIGMAKLVETPVPLSVLAEELVVKAVPDSDTTSVGSICTHLACVQSQLTQGKCYDHCIICPKCEEEPCNPDSPNPQCKKCVAANVETVACSFGSIESADACWEDALPGSLYCAKHKDGESPFVLPQTAEIEKPTPATNTAKSAASESSTTPDSITTTPTEECRNCLIFGQDSCSEHSSLEPHPPVRICSAFHEGVGPCMGDAIPDSPFCAGHQPTKPPPLDPIKPPPPPVVTPQVPNDPSKYDEHGRLIIDSAAINRAFQRMYGPK